jgi:tetratricopeptide (TPR) repeat protein
MRGIFQKLFGGAKEQAIESTVNLGGEEFDRKKVLWAITETGVPVHAATEMLQHLVHAQENGPIEDADRINDIGLGLFTRGNPQAALPFSLVALQMHRRLLGDDKASTAGIMANTAHVYRALGQYPSAIALFENALAIYRQHPEDNADQFSGSVNMLGIVYTETEEFDKALPFAQEFVAMQRTVTQKDPQESPTLATSLNNLANLYAQMSKTKNARQCFEEALEIRRRFLGNEHPETMQSLISLARFNKDQGDFVKTMSPLMEDWGGLPKNEEGDQEDSDEHYNKSANLWEEVLAIQRRTLGNQHPDTTNSINSLANVYYGMKNYEKSIPLFAECLTFYRTALRDDIPQLTIAMVSLATMYHTNEEYEKAIPLYEEALGLCHKSLGNNHPNTQQISAFLTNARAGRLN